MPETGRRTRVAESGYAARRHVDRVRDPSVPQHPRLVTPALDAEDGAGDHGGEFQVPAPEKVQHLGVRRGLLRRHDEDVRAGAREQLPQEGVGEGTADEEEGSEAGNVRVGELERVIDPLQDDALRVDDGGKHGVS